MTQNSRRPEEVVRIPNTIGMRNMDRPLSSVEATLSTDKLVHEHQLNTSMSPYRAAYLRSHRHK